MPIHSLRERISGRSLHPRSDHRDDDTKSVSSARTFMSSKSRTPKLVSSPTATNRPTLGAFFNVSKHQVNIVQRSKLNRQKERDVRKNRKSSILASLDKFIDGDQDEATDVTTETVPVSDHSISSHMSLEMRSRPPSAQRKHPKRLDSSQSVGGEAPPRKERYRRRGSVTKFSLGDDQQEDHGGLSREFDDNASMLSIGADSVQSESVLQNSGSTSTTTPRPRYRRRGSVTKFSLEATAEEQVKQPKQPKQPKKVQQDFDDTSSTTNVSRSSSCAGDSVQSATKFTLEESRTSTQHAPKKDTLSSSNHSSSLPVSTIGGDNGSFSTLGNISALYDEDGLGYGSMHSATPPPRATPSPDAYGYGEETDSVSQRPPRKERYRRRGSVTKYSLEAQDQVKKELQAGSTLKKKKELEDSSTANKELEDSSTHSLQFEELVLARSKRSSTEASRPPRHPRKNRLVPSQPIS
jgi:hypothetical protein